jgi:hypothetical protein
VEPSPTVGYIPTLIGTHTVQYSTDPVTIFLYTYYNWIIFGIGVFLIIFSIRQLYLKKKKDPLHYEDIDE